MVNIRSVCVRMDGTIRDALTAIDRSGAGIALITDPQGKLVGTVTDGDVRRALLKAASLESPLAPCIQAKFTAVSTGVGRAEVLDLMQARLLNQVPVIDSSGVVVGLHLLHEIIGAANRPNWAVIMAGGRGTRLSPITEHLPKPMLRVAGRPILERLVLHLVGFGVKRVFLSINYLGHLVEQHFGDGERFGCRIEYLRETESMGTGGSISLLPSPPVDPLLVLNGDLVTQANVERMLAFHEQERCLATVGVRRYARQVPFGCVDAVGGRVRRFEEKPVVERLISAGIYVLSPEVVARIPRRHFPITDLFEDCLGSGEPIAAFEIEDDWIDVGQQDQLRQAREGTDR